ncbi:VWA domain-containing protein [Allomuricauda sp. SCSIO 65647]|uniref:VWA domain-containing protein n=1 Tax=Allomuricauda sp. SCSIO 65647 TaxID=2908843 RepID=UPI001F1CD974|nr:VWA domain-containing protein [Muricauda sp. SCSIO 65647]UJH67240.1 VWA domain-containing protein [Muricauda sp. SCSIO 65647]
MQTQTILLIILAGFASLVVAYWQYLRKAKRSNLKVTLFFLRFLSFFVAALLLINPKFTRHENFVEKPNLVMAIDNSESISRLGGVEAFHEISDKIQGTGELADRFNIFRYGFDNTVSVGDSIDFGGKYTNVHNALQRIEKIHDRQNTALVLLTDGNQNLGFDYEFQKYGDGLTIFPLVLGDTTRYEDFWVERINLNRYAFLNNKFPVEVTVIYEGDGPRSTEMQVFMDGQLVQSVQLSFDSDTNSTTIDMSLQAGTVGNKTITASIGRLPNERNTANNSKQAVIEVIDEKTNVALVSDKLHPDMGVLKKAIESNAQRQVAFKNPNIDLETLDDFDVLILYQPNRSFQKIYDYIKNRGIGVFTIAGTKTDWNFLNSVQSAYTKESFRQAEDVFPVKNETFGLFDLGGLSVEGFPPLKIDLGEIMMNQNHEPLFFQRIRGVDMEAPLMTVLNDPKEIVLFGEDIWKWRIETYRQNGSFEAFDALLGRLLLNITANAAKRRLTVNYNSIYDGKMGVVIGASYFDKAFVFDANASLGITVKNTETGQSRTIPMLLKGNRYDVDLGDLPAGEYDFTVTVGGENTSRSGSFKILDFDLEGQFLSANDDKLQRLAEKSNGRLFYPDQNGDLVQQLLTDERFVPIQKGRQNVVSLIDFRILLGLLALTLAAEWFIRKYNGLL